MFTTSPFQPWWIHALPETTFWMSSVENPRSFGLRPSAHSLALSTSAGSVELSSAPLTMLPAPMTSWKSSSR
jgi:hypothetical protein